jgi:hypothetical protein
VGGHPAVGNTPATIMRKGSIITSNYLFPVLTHPGGQCIPSSAKQTWFPLTSFWDSAISVRRSLILALTSASSEEEETGLQRPARLADSRQRQMMNEKASNVWVSIFLFISTLCGSPYHGYISWSIQRGPKTKILNSPVSARRA